MEEGIIVRLANGQTLPCGVLVAGDGETDAITCKQPASVLCCDPAPDIGGWRWRGLLPGQWVCLPVCEEHAKAMAGVYADPEPLGSPVGGRMQSL
jgi:hypothetical protein